MKVAIPLFGTRVSPRFDGGAVVLLAEVNGDTVVSVRQVTETSANSLERIAHLREWGVETVVCGAITGFVLRHLVANGIRVFPWVFGEASEVLHTLARGELQVTPHRGMGPGRGRGRRGRGRGGARWSR